MAQLDDWMEKLQGGYFGSIAGARRSIGKLKMLGKKKEAALVAAEEFFGEKSKPVRIADLRPKKGVPLGKRQPKAAPAPAASPVDVQCDMMLRQAHMAADAYWKLSQVYPDLRRADAEDIFDRLLMPAVRKLIETKEEAAASAPQ